MHLRHRFSQNRQWIARPVSPAHGPATVPLERIGDHILNPRSPASVLEGVPERVERLALVRDLEAAPQAASKSLGEVDGDYTLAVRFQSWEQPRTVTLHRFPSFGDVLEEAAADEFRVYWNLTPGRSGL